MLSEVAADRIEIGSPHVKRVRIGQHADMVRVVVDAGGVAISRASLFLTISGMALDDFSAATECGLVCLGKTHMSELAFSGLGVNPITATPPNAFEPERAPGGSSSGAAVSTALGLAAAGIGSDTGGRAGARGARPGATERRPFPGP